MDFAVKFLTIVCALELGVIVVTHWFYSRQIHKLLDKLMSRDYQTYHATVAPPKKETIRIPTEVPEDLRVLQGFQIP